MSSLFDLSNCTLCPRECGVDRTAGQLGFCGLPADIRAARAALLFYEEPCISGTNGSGAIFFTGCNLGCVFCQNAAISGGLRNPIASAAHLPDIDSTLSRTDREVHSESASATVISSGSDRSNRHDYAAGSIVTSEDLVRLMLNLQEQGVSNINLVTASHVLHALIPALEYARSHGLTIPVVYNTSAYEKAEAIRALDGLIDIYLPDLKFYSSELAQRYAKAPRYWEAATAAIEEMVRQCPVPVFADGSHSLEAEDDREDPLMTKGVIVRHMVMPGQVEDSKRIIRYLYETYHDQIFLSIMNQYTPMPQCAEDPLLSRPVTEKEYDEVVDFAISLGVENGFLQEGGTISKSFIPSWDGTGIT